MKSDYRKAGIDRATQGLLEYAELLTRDPGACSIADIERLRSLGLTDEAILEAVHVVCLYNYVNRMADALGVEVDAQFRGDE